MMRNGIRSILLWLVSKNKNCLQEAGRRFLLFVRLLPLGAHQCWKYFTHPVSLSLGSAMSVLKLEEQDITSKISNSLHCSFHTISGASHLFSVLYVGSCTLASFPFPQESFLLSLLWLQMHYHVESLVMTASGSDGA